MKKLPVFILTGLLPVSVFAVDPYGGIGIVKSSWNDVEYDRVNAKGFVGFKFSDHFAGELQYTNFAKENLIVDDTSGLAVGFEGSSFGGALLYNIAPESEISAFAKIGSHAWGAHIPVGGVTISFDNTDLFYGVGIDIKIDTRLTDALSVRFAYERFLIDDSHIDNVGVSIVFGF